MSALTEALRDKLDDVGWAQREEADKTVYHDALWEWVKEATNTIAVLERRLEAPVSDSDALGWYGP